MPSRSALVTEAQIIRRIHLLSSKASPSSHRVILPQGDDAAAFRVRPGFLMLVSTDALVEGIHFSLMYFSPEELGWKALAVNLSDIAAVGGTPLYFTTTLALPKTIDRTFVNGFYRGILQLANMHDVVLIGGDTCSSQKDIFVDVTILGDVKPNKVLRRAGAKPGDSIFVTGELGGSAIGLELLTNYPGIARREPLLTGRHLRPVPRCESGRFLAENRIASSMIDVSDGLSTDLHHLCEQSSVGAIIEADKIPLPRVNSKTARLLTHDLVNYGLNGGEDYELLFTVPPSMRPTLPRDIFGLQVHEIGQITRRSGCRIQQSGRMRKLLPAGFDHFEW